MLETTFQSMLQTRCDDVISRRRLPMDRLHTIVMLVIVPVVHNTEASTIGVPARLVTVLSDQHLPSARPKDVNFSIEYIRGHVHLKLASVLATPQHALNICRKCFGLAIHLQPNNISRSFKERLQLITVTRYVVDDALAQDVVRDTAIRVIRMLKKLVRQRFEETVPHSGHLDDAQRRQAACKRCTQSGTTCIDLWP